jgi:hypothetical protein
MAARYGNDDAERFEPIFSGDRGSVAPAPLTVRSGE